MATELNHVEVDAQAIKKLLFAEPDTNLYAVLDGASVPDLLPQLDDLQPENVCLYRGELEPDIKEVAPYLVQLDPDSAFLEWLIEEGWGNHWGIFVSAPVELATLRQHFRKFLIVHDSDGKPLYFRYYDPRVLRVYLPTCNEDELMTIFGPATSYMMEDSSTSVLVKFQNIDGGLKQEKKPLM